LLASGADPPLTKRSQPMRQYRLPLRLITQGKWADMIPPARAILPIIGLHADPSGKAFPGMILLQKLSGIGNKHTLINGLKCLQELDLLEIQKVARPGKQGRHNLYYLYPPAIWESSYYPMYENFLISGRWARLSPGEKSAFAVLAVKATLKPSHYRGRFDKFTEDEDWKGCGVIREFWYKLAGISRRSWFRAVKKLNHRGEILPLANRGYILARQETQGNERSAKIDT